jgi:hypothetical protein
MSKITAQMTLAPERGQAEVAVNSDVVYSDRIFLIHFL